MKPLKLADMMRLAPRSCKRKTHGDLRVVVRLGIQG